jgi:hypothetical protein
LLTLHNGRRSILPNRPIAKVCSFEQTAVDDPAKISGNFMDVCSGLLRKMHDA